MLYKFRRLNKHTLDELKNSYLYFANVSTLNDPMEGFYTIFFEKTSYRDRDFWKKLFRHFLTYATKSQINRVSIENFDLEPIIDVVQNCKKVKQWHLQYILMLIFKAFVKFNKIQIEQIYYIKTILFINDEQTINLNFLNTLKFKPSLVSRYLQNMKKDITNEPYVYCFTEHCPISDNAQLMWAYYADCGNGICLEFDDFSLNDWNFRFFKTNKNIYYGECLSFGKIDYTDGAIELQSEISINNDKISLIRKSTDNTEPYKYKSTKWSHER